MPSLPSRPKHILSILGCVFNLVGKCYIARLGEEMDRYIEARRRATGFDIRYNATLEPGEDSWRNCATVFARRDLDSLMRQGR